MNEEKDADGKDEDERADEESKVQMQAVNGFINARAHLCGTFSHAAAKNSS